VSQHVTSQHDMNQHDPGQLDPGQHDARLTLGPFHVGASGALEPMMADPAPGFTCRWRNRTLHANLLPSDQTDWRLLLRTPLTRVPSSARAPEAGRRMASFALLRELPATLPDGWHIGLAADHSVVLEVEQRARLPLTATALISEITMFLLTLAPYLDVLDEAGLVPLVEPVGTANT